MMLMFYAQISFSLPIKPPGRDLDKVHVGSMEVNGL